MKKKIIGFILLLCTSGVYAAVDTVKVPIFRQLFHDRINQEQKLLDKADGKSDGMINATVNEEINLAITEALTKKIDGLEDMVETNEKIRTNNEKIRYLNYIQTLLRSYRNAWRSKQLNPVYAAELVNRFEKVMNANTDSISMAPLIEPMPYEAARIITEIFTDNPGFKESKKILFLKFSALYPDKILQHIEPYVDEPFADSLVVVCCKNNPTAVYSASQAPESIVGKLIHRSTNPVVTTVIAISKTPNALLYFPFLDDLLNERQTVADIKKYVGDGQAPYDSVGYFHLLVQTEISYFKRMAPPLRDTPIAMLGPNGLREMLHDKAIQHFITPINALHNQGNLAIRMKAIEPLSAIDLYYMIIMGENDIYTSSYKHSFNRLLQRLGKPSKTDSLLMKVHFDYFKKFIKMAANYNQLDTFLKLMPQSKSRLLMKAFVSNLDKTGSLEDAVDVADSYSSINDKKLLKTILDNVIENEKNCIENNNQHGKTIYGLLKTIFLSGDSSKHTDLTAETGIPSIYTVNNKYLSDDSGRIIEQSFFYGDKDGMGIFNGFINSFSPKEWKVTMKPNWVEIKSLKGQKVWIYANRPLDNDSNKDDTAQINLTKYLQQNDLEPSIVIHRGHSYWLPHTIDMMMGNAKIVVLGSCGGFRNLNQILDFNPDAHIISTKEIGKGDINKPVINYINQSVVSGKTLVWKNMWGTLTRQFAASDRDTRESWDDYVPPYKNLGAIFIKAYTKKMEKE